MVTTTATVELSDDMVPTFSSSGVTNITYFKNHQVLLPNHEWYRTLGGPQSRSGRRGEESSWLYRDSNSDPSVVQPLASHYTDWAIPDPHSGLLFGLFFDPEDGGAKCPLTFCGLHGVVSQKIELLKTAQSLGLLPGLLFVLCLQNSEGTASNV
jgi:hypothetical protein